MTYKIVLMSIVFSYITVQAMNLNETLFDAIRKRDVQRVQGLIQDGADVNAKNTAMCNWTPLMVAANLGTKEIAELLVQAGAAINTTEAGGKTALIIAAFWGRADIVALLLDVHAHSNVQEAKGNIALIWAINRQHQDIALMLLDAGADFTIKTKQGKTALDFAKERGYKDIENIINRRILARQRLTTLRKAAIQAMMEHYPHMPKEIIEYTKSFIK